MEDEDLDESEMLKNYHINDDAIDSELYSQIRNSKRLTKEIKMMYAHPEDLILPNEEVNSINWCINKNISEPPGLGIRPPTHIKKEFQNHIFRTEVDSLLAFLPLMFWIFHLGECNRYVAQEMKAKQTDKFHGKTWKRISLVS